MSTQAALLLLVSGTVESIGPRGITVNSRTGRHSVVIAPETRFVNSNAKSRPNWPKVGDPVVVHILEEGEHRFFAVEIHFGA